MEGNGGIKVHIALSYYGFKWIDDKHNNDGQNHLIEQTVSNGCGEKEWANNYKFMRKQDDGKYVHYTSFSGTVKIGSTYCWKPIEETCSHCCAALPVWKHRRECPLLN